MSVYLYSAREIANVLRFLSCRSSGDSLSFDSARLAAQHDLCPFYSFGLDSYHVVMDPRFPIHLMGEDVIGLGKAMLANVRAFNHAAENAKTPREGVREETAEHYARALLVEALKIGPRPDFAEAVDTVNLLAYNTVDNGGGKHAPSVDGAEEYLASMMVRAFGLLADMWRRGEKETW